MFKQLKQAYFKLLHLPGAYLSVGLGPQGFRMPPSRLVATKFSLSL